MISTAPVHCQSCSCSTRARPTRFDQQVNAFYELRNSCPALRLTIPDELEERHARFSTTEPDSALHCSVPFLAYRRGCLPEFTASLHEFATTEEGVRSDLPQQYLKDLRETWVLESDEGSRFSASRRYLSRLAELHFAHALKAENWEIMNLEMYGGNFDVEAQSHSRIAAAFEVKFLAKREVVFELNRASFSNPTFGWLGVYSPMDYLLFRLYQAALQLQAAEGKRIAVAIVSDYEISYELPLCEGWIDWTNPAFLKRDSEIGYFLSEQYANNPQLDADIKTFITSLSEIWILRYESSFELKREHRIQIS